MSEETLPATIPQPVPIGHDNATLIAMCDNMTRMEDLLADPDFDPEKFIGDLKQKVDGTKNILDAQKAFQGFLQGKLTPIQKKATQIGKNWGKLREYVVKCMRLSDSEELPGEIFQIILRRHHTPDVIEHRPATVHDFVKFGDGFVKQATVYLWKSDEIRDLALAGKLKLADNLGHDPKEGECKHLNQIWPVDEGQCLKLGGKCDDCKASLPPRSSMPLSLAWTFWPEFKVKVPQKLEKKKKVKTNGISAKARKTKAGGADVPSGATEADPGGPGQTGSPDQGCATGADANDGGDAPIQTDRAHGDQTVGETSAG